MLSGSNTATFQKQCGFKFLVNILSILNQVYECFLMKNSEANI